MATKQDSAGDSYWIDEQNSLWKIFFNSEHMEQQEKLGERENVTQVAGCDNHIVVIGENGLCWGTGNNHNGQLSGGTFAYSYKFERIYGIDNVVKVTVGRRNTVFLDCDGTVWACGDNNSGQILLNHLPRVFSPTIVAGFPQCTAISAGPECIYAVDVHGAVWLTGYSGAINCKEFNVLEDNASSVLPRKLNFETPIEYVSANENTCLFASEDGQTLWRCTNRNASTKSIFEDGIKQICETRLLSVVLDRAGILWTWNP